MSQLHQIDRSALPVAVIGAGPVGLAAAAHLVTKGETPLVLEAGGSVGENVLMWGHVRVFSPWRYNIDSAASALLETTGWTAPQPGRFPTGRELVESYLAPLADLPQLRPHIQLRTRVLAVARHGFDKLKTDGRDNAPFALTVQSADGVEDTVLAKAVIDASGTYATPNPLGANGVPVPGERTLADRIFAGIPDVLDRDRARYAGRRVVVVGSGHSAFNVLLDLADLAEAEPSTEITWAVRRSSVGQMFGGGERDLLPARGRLGRRVREMVESGAVRFVTDFRVTRLSATDDGMIVHGERDTLPPVDEIVATTGFRPDLSLLSELRLSLDPSVESPPALAPLIDPNIHSCGTVPPHGAEELRHPEPDLYIVGMKSYGRAPTFLMLTGYEQVRSVVCAITGDWEGARDVRLELPGTGVCSTDNIVPREQSRPIPVLQTAGESATGCCGTATPVLQSAGTSTSGGGCCS